MNTDPCTREAILWRSRGAEGVECFLCAHGCKIVEGRRGICGVRENRSGSLETLVYGRLVAERPDPIEKKPLYHFLPDTLSHSIATAGCNMKCANCQNYEISQVAKGGSLPGVWTPPGEVVARAASYGAASISYTYTEPTIFLEYALDVMKLAHEAGLANVFVSNGFMSEEALSRTSGLLDAANIDLKAFDDRFYRQNCGARLAPVLENIATLKKQGVWVEITTLLIPTMNDSDGELEGIAGFIHSIDPGMPWHISGFHPTFNLVDKPATPASSLVRARELGLARGLKFVYMGNRPGSGGEDTNCPGCGRAVLTRSGFRIRSNGLDKRGCCPGCGAQVPGRFSKGE